MIVQYRTLLCMKQYHGSCWFWPGKSKSNVNATTMIANYVWNRSPRHNMPSVMGSKRSLSRPSHEEPRPLVQRPPACGFQRSKVTWENQFNDVRLVKIGPVTGKNMEKPSIIITCCQWASFKPLYESTDQWEKDIYEPVAHVLIIYSSNGWWFHPVLSMSLGSFSAQCQLNCLSPSKWTSLEADHVILAQNGNS